MRFVRPDKFTGDSEKMERLNYLWTRIQKVHFDDEYDGR